MLSSLINSPGLKLGAVVVVSVAMTTASSAEAATIFDVTGSIDNLAVTSGPFTTQTIGAKLRGMVTYEPGSGVTAAQIFLGEGSGPLQGLGFTTIGSNTPDGRAFSLLSQPITLGGAPLVLPLSFDFSEPPYSATSLSNGSPATAVTRLSLSNTSVYITGRGSTAFVPRAADVPTPAMLPGLFALGVTTWRKRRQKAAELIRS
jgi:hypothetical protein